MERIYEGDLSLKIGVKPDINLNMLSSFYFKEAVFSFISWERTK